MSKRGDLLNQLAIISDLFENVNLETKSVTVILETNKEQFDLAFDYIEKKYGKKIDVFNDTFTITIGFVDIIFNMNNA
jgi:plasmid replication initiation protein